MDYREMPHMRPTARAILPAFIVSQYTDGSLLLYSHGGFDIWCVYHAMPIGGRIVEQPVVGDSLYPFRLCRISIDRMRGRVTDFEGNFSSVESIEYKSNAISKRIDLKQKFSFDAPEDVDYLQSIRNLARAYGQDNVWKSFLTLYEAIPQKRGVPIQRNMTDAVMSIVSDYPRENGLRLTLDCLLCAMIAENNRLRKYGSKFDTRVGKKVKALGVYQAIYETGLTVRQVANFSKGQRWNWISNECAKRGILTSNL